MVLLEFGFLLFGYDYGFQDSCTRIRNDNSLNEADFYRLGFIAFCSAGGGEVRQSSRTEHGVGERWTYIS
jgi:hypothetical protein